VKVFTTGGNFREAWVGCPANYTAISASAQRAAATAAIYRWEPGAMTGPDAQSNGAGNPPPGGTGFTASASGDTGANAPNGYHFSTSTATNTSATRLVLICIPD
jgi:hypothetical protein